MGISTVGVYHGPKNVSGEKVAAALDGLRIPFRLIAGREIAAGQLEDFGGIIFPGGHSIRLGPCALAKMREFVSAGGGFLGICAGAQFGAALGLIDVRHRVLRGSGIFDLRIIARHPVTACYEVAGPHRPVRRWTYSNRGRVRMRYVNGGFYEAGRGARVLVSFDEEGLMGAIVAGCFGRGRVVLVTPHPESTPRPEGNTGNDSDKSQDPMNLFGNAVRYIARGRQ